ncbi:MAG: preprotein translocase subunit SecY [Microthrixaceae bacterium]|nr:preprotein translocase subunit SecY [Microthrixaceae bacterium]
MFKSLRTITKIPDLRNKILFTLGMLVLYRVGSYVMVPGIDQNAVTTIKEQAKAGGVLGFLTLFSGKALTNFAVFALGIMPYITSSIIMQILTVVIPRLQEWQEQGAVGQRKITQWTRYVTIGISLIQSTGLVYVFHRQGGGFTSGDTQNLDLVPNFNFMRVSLIVLTLTAGSALLMWMGEAITQRGIGNGMSLIIFASVVSTLPGTFTSIKSSDGWGGIALLIAIMLVMLSFIVFMEQGQRRIPVQFAKRVVGRKQYGGQSTYIPLKVNMAGVIPIIFASAVLNLPVLLSQVLPADGWGKTWQKWINDHLTSGTSPYYLVFFGLLIFGFSFFYTTIQFDPVQQADNLRKQGGFIPGIRPGPQTERYLAKVLNRITVPGALFVMAIALVPAILLANLLSTTSAGIGTDFGGVSLLIAVGVALETMKQIDGQLMMRNYEGFLKL